MTSLDGYRLTSGDEIRLLSHRRRRGLTLARRYLKCFGRKVSFAPEVDVTGEGMKHSNSLESSRSVSIYVHVAKGVDDNGYLLT